MTNSNNDHNDFEKKWRKLCLEICQALYVLPEIQKLKNNLQTNGFLALDEKSQFIDLCNSTKYKVIQKNFGNEGSEGYLNFSVNWKAWFETKGVGSAYSKGQRDSVEHLMFGSTPDPEKFLLHFEQEILGSLEKL